MEGIHVNSSQIIFDIALDPHPDLRQVHIPHENVYYAFRYYASFITLITLFSPGHADCLLCAMVFRIILVVQHFNANVKKNTEGLNPNQTSVIYWCERLVYVSQQLPLTCRFPKYDLISRLIWKCFVRSSGCWFSWGSDHSAWSLDRIRFITSQSDIVSQSHLKQYWQKWHPDQNISDMIC